jgi:hypothetical protein
LPSGRLNVMLVPMGSSDGFLEGPIGGYFVRSRVRKQSVARGRYRPATQTIVIPA